MDVWQFFSDVFLHLDETLAEFVRQYHAWTYPVVFVIVFAETGLVFTPFLPGDSLLFAAGALAAAAPSGGSPDAAADGGAAGLSLGLLFVLLAGAAILGDTVNYWVGKYLGSVILRSHMRLIRKEHLDRTHAFFEKYGGKTIVIARFVPIIRTVAPFVAGLGAMTYRAFLAYNVFGGVLWVALCLGAGYFFGNLKPVREHFSLVVLAIIVISLMPAVFSYLNARAQARAARRS